jgi:beta-galactosidase beta subunit
MFKKVKKKYAMCIICVLFTDFPESLSVLTSMFYHFEPDNDFAIRCILKTKLGISKVVVKRKASY